MNVIIQQVTMLEDFRKDKDPAEKTFSVHAEVFQPIAMCFDPKKTTQGQQEAVSLTEVYLLG